MPHRILLAALTIYTLTASELAADMPASPYAGQQTRAIKALSPEDIAALRNGAGMGMAKAAELNGYPGPAHVLALAAQLGLTKNQQQRVTAIFERMSMASLPRLSDPVAAHRQSIPFRVPSRVRPADGSARKRAHDQALRSPQRPGHARSGRADCPLNVIPPTTQRSTNAYLVAA